MSRVIKFRAWNKTEKQWDNNPGSFHVSAIEQPYDHIEWCEFTGLTDKNGKEIYEGDVVYDRNDEQNYPIVFEEAGFWAKGRENEYGLGNPEEDWEVIGNIYENPELI